MKSRRIRVIYPVYVPDEALHADVAAQLPAEFIRPGIEVEFMATRDGATLVDSYADIELMDMFVYEAGLRAARDGVDAICINTTSDSAVNALRSRLDIPVIGPGSSCMHLACLLGHKFSIITMWDRWKLLYKRTLDAEGLWHRVASIRATDTDPDPQKLLAGKESEVFPKIERACRQAIEEDGADVIIIGSTTMHRVHRYLLDRLDVPVLNPGQVAHKMCEMYLDLGITHSKRAYVAPLHPRDDLIFRTLGSADAGK